MAHSGCDAPVWHSSVVRLARAKNTREQQQGGRTLAHRAHSQGYYWPTMRQDAQIYVRKCDKCQKHAPIPHVPAETLNSVASPWPFSQWGMDIMGPLPTTASQKKFLLVATDYFSKRVEVEAYASIKDKDVTRFVWKNIVCRFGIPQAIIADNDPQFDSSTFKDFCAELHIKNLYSQPRYPQSNGQAEVTNKTLLSAWKKRLEKAKGKWVEELPGVLWAYRITPGWPTGNTSFDLAYGMDVVIPTEVGMPTARTAIQGQRNEDGELARHLDWADEAKEAASIRMAAYQQKVAFFIPPFLTGPNMRYKRGHCGILPKNCYVAPSPLDTQTAPCDTWHRSFHPDISHPEFFSADIPPGYLTFGIPLRQHSTRISHIRNSVRPTFHLLRIFHSRRMSPGERGRRFNFPGKTCSDPLVTLTRTAWLVRRSRFVGSISAHNKKDNSDNTDDQVS